MKVTILFLTSALISAFDKVLGESISNSGFHFKTHLYGHSAYFYQNFSDYPIENPLGSKIIQAHIYEFIGLPREDVIRCLFIESWPRLFIERDENGFLARGPFYSVVEEAARLINYR